MWGVTVFNYAGPLKTMKNLTLSISDTLKLDLFQQLLLVKETMWRVNRYMNILMYGKDQLINWGLNRSFGVWVFQHAGLFMMWYLNQMWFILLMCMVEYTQILVQVCSTSRSKNWCNRLDALFSCAVYWIFQLSKLHVSNPSSNIFYDYKWYSNLWFHLTGHSSIVSISECSIWCMGHTVE